MLSKENDSWFTDAHREEMTVRVPEVTVCACTCPRNRGPSCSRSVMHRFDCPFAFLCRWVSISGSHTRSASRRSSLTSWRRTHWRCCHRSLSAQALRTRAEGVASSFDSSRLNERILNLLLIATVSNDWLSGSGIQTIHSDFRNVSYFYLRPPLQALGVRNMQCCCRYQSGM